MIPNMESYLLFQSNISRLAKMKKTPDRLLYTLPYREQHTNTHRTQYKYFTSVYTYTNMYPLHKRYREQKKETKFSFWKYSIVFFFVKPNIISCKSFVWFTYLFQKYVHITNTLLWSMNTFRSPTFESINSK